MEKDSVVNTRLSTVNKDSFHSLMISKYRLCLMFGKHSQIKPSRMVEHLSKMYPDKVRKDVEYFRQMKNIFFLKSS